ncbi:MAG: hypothetical protein FD123_1429 [Bacteroidetes bacterium]|nr:MAG: hypothetical protein FD123_1429 [Bacteroidota bacterium]
MRFHFQMLLLLCYCSGMQAQQVTSQYLYPGNAYFLRTCGIVQLPDSTYIIAGDYRNGSGVEEKLLIKTDPCGRMLWRKNYPAAGPSVAAALLLMPSNQLLLCGSVKDTSYWRMHLIKLDTAGTVLFDKRYHVGTTSGSNCYAKDLVQVNDSTYYLAGYDQNGSSVVNIFVQKTDSSGNSVGSSYFFSSGVQDSCTAMIRTREGAFAYLKVSNIQKELIRTYVGSLSSLSWAYSLPDVPVALRQLPDSSYVVFGHIGSGSTRDLYWLRVNKNGGLVWQKTFLLSAQQDAVDMIVTSDTCLLFAASTSGVSSSSCGKGLLMLKVDLNGDSLWTNTVSWANSCRWAGAVMENNEGGFAFAGYSGLFSSLPVDGYFVKIDGSACVYPVPVGLSAAEKITGAPFVFPQPSSDVAHIQIPMNKTNCSPELILFTPDGKCMDAGIQSVQWSDGKLDIEMDCRPLPAGFYYFKVYSDQAVFSGKICVSK